MKSLVGELVAVGSRLRNATTTGDARTPIAYEQTPVVPWFTGDNYDTLLRAYTADPALHAVTDRVVTDISQYDWDLYTRPPSGRAEDRAIVASHAVIDLWEQPNEFMDRIEFLENSWLHYELAAETYWVIGVNDAAPDLPLSLWPVSPADMSPWPSRTGYLNPPSSAARGTESTILRAASSPTMAAAAATPVSYTHLTLPTKRIV